MESVSKIISGRAKAGLLFEGPFGQGDAFIQVAQHIVHLVGIFRHLNLTGKINQRFLAFLRACGIGNVS